MTTGVTDFTKIGEVRQVIDSVYPNPGEDAIGELQVANNGYSHLLVGHAFEYLCRVLLYRRYGEILRPWSRYGSEEPRWTGGETPRIAVERFDGMNDEENTDGSSWEEWEGRQDEVRAWERDRSAVQWTEDEELTKVVEQYIETGMNTDRVVRAALVDAGWKPAGSVESWIDRAAFADDLLDEMGALFELLREASWTEGETLIEKPQFGNHRYVLPGEGDFIVDDLLVDIKTTERRTFTKEFWRQLLLYYVLCDVQQAMYDERYGDDEDVAEIRYPDINRVGIYFARYGELQTVEMDSVIEDRDRYEEFRAWIVDRGIEENRHAQKNYQTVREALTEPYEYKRQQTFSDF